MYQLIKAKCPDCVDLIRNIIRLSLFILINRTPGFFIPHLTSPLLQRSLQVSIFIESTLGNVFAYKCLHVYLFLQHALIHVFFNDLHSMLLSKLKI